MGGSRTEQDERQQNSTLHFICHPLAIGVIGEVKSRKLFLLEVEIEGLEYCETLRYGTEMSAQLFPLSAS